jgi:hypothetical protein
VIRSLFVLGAHGINGAGRWVAFRSAYPQPFHERADSGQGAMEAVRLCAAVVNAKLAGIC